MFEVIEVKANASPEEIEKVLFGKVPSLKDQMIAFLSGTGMDEVKDGDDLQAKAIALKTVDFLADLAKDNVDGAGAFIAATAFVHVYSQNPYIQQCADTELSNIADKLADDFNATPWDNIKDDSSLAHWAENKCGQPISEKEAKKLRVYLNEALAKRFNEKNKV